MTGGPLGVACLDRRDLSNNKLYGTIPTELGLLSSTLQYL